MRTLAIAKRVLKELVRDKRTLALMFIAPVLIMWLMNVMFSANSSTNVKLATVNVNTTVVTNLDKVKHVSVTQLSNHQAKQKLADHKVDGIIRYTNHKYDVTYANTDSSKTGLTKQALRSAITGETMTTMTTTIQKLQAQLPVAVQAKMGQQHQVTAPQIKNHYRYGDADTNFFAKIIPILMGFFIFFFVFLISGMGLLNERITGTLGRVLATPVRRSEIVFGYMLSYGLLAVIQSTVIVLATIWLLKLQVSGSIISIIAISLLFALVALAFGILMSTLANSEFQMMQFIPLVVVPQIFFSGIIPLDSMAGWVQYIGKVLPLTYTGDALSKIVLQGTSITKLGGDILALCIFLVILVFLNIIGLKRYRKV
ncbi:ABC transporter permease [Lactobacillus sp. 3B(2020)]|uniref:ABC transporter permease n=1 Tax=Lactobacillus sp. 3B(2020) TaxID=2695882 RepID=UPI0015DE6543|nr:ABC transporter permease [Lactobacillus sp. 3B(2020)]QLL70845.1 ABC transporter permease [Lactobacillus sp. 3B(2020)]